MRKLVIVLVVAVLAVTVGWNLAVNAVVSGASRAITGLDTRVGHLSIGWLKTDVGITNLRVGNPAGFPKDDMIAIPEVYVNYQLGSFFSGQPHLEEIRLHLAQFTVVKAADGRLNLNAIKALQEGKPAADATQPAKKSEAMKFRIDRLALKVDKVVYKDYTQTPPTIKEFNVNIDETHEGITNPYTFAGLIVARTLLKTPIAVLANFDVNGLASNVTGALKDSQALLAGGLDTAQQVGRQAAGAAKEALGSAQGVGQDALGAAKDVAGSAKDAVGGATQGLKKLLGQ